MTNEIVLESDSSDDENENADIVSDEQVDDITKDVDAVSEETECKNTGEFNEIQDEKPKRRGRPRGDNYRPRAPSRSTEKVISEDDDTIVVLKNRKKPVQKKKIVIYKEDIHEEIPIEVEVKSKRGRGRPRTKHVIQEVNEAEKVEIERPAPPPKQPTEREIRKLELQEKLVQAEAMLGKKTRLTRKGEVDKRYIGQRSEAQKKATEKMLLARKVQREIKEREKAKRDNERIDESVKKMVSSLAKAKTQVQTQVQASEPEKPKVDLSIFG